MNKYRQADRRVVKIAAAKLGVRINSAAWGHGWEITIDAPDGQHWQVSQCSQLIAHQVNRGPWGIGELWTSLVSDILAGLEPCDESCGHLEE